MLPHNRKNREDELKMELTPEQKKKYDAFKETFSSLDITIQDYIIGELFKIRGG